MRKIFISILLVLIMTLSCFPPLNPFTAAAEDKFIDNPKWIETSTEVVNGIFNSLDSGNNEPFVVMFFKYSCFNSNLRKIIVNSWMNDYNINVYGVDVDQNSISSWVWRKLPGSSVTLPVICMVKNKSEYSVFSAKTSMNTIQRSLHELLGVYDASVVDFYLLNRQIYNNYNTASAAALNYLKPRSQFDPLIVSQADAIVAGLTDDYEKLLAIHDWVAGNIYYDHVLFSSGSANSSAYSDIGTLKNRASVCSGYANLTSSLCQAAGIPCRVKTGFALGVGSDDKVTTVWTAYNNYVEDRDFTALTDSLKGYSNHAWNEAYVNGRWVIMDTTWDSNNDKYATGKIKGDIGHTYFDPDLRPFVLD